jgi:hypothetical protein
MHTVKVDLPMSSTRSFTWPTVETGASPEVLRGSSQFRFCSGRCQEERPPEGGVELAPGKWRCGACWIEMARKRQ